MEKKSNSSDNDLFGNVCDDVCEQILGYLPFKDKIKLEGVSKQWQMCIYRQQTELLVLSENIEDNRFLNKLSKPIENRDFATGFAHSRGYKEIKKNEFEFVLKRCLLLRTVMLHCYIDDNDLQLIGKYLEKLNEIHLYMFGITKNGLLEFGRNYGHKLNTLCLFASKYNDVLIDEFLIYCPNIKDIFMDYHLSYICEDKTFLPKLEIVKFNFDRDSELINTNIEKLRVCTKKYSKTLKELEVSAIEFGFTALLFIQLLENLENIDLSLYFENYDDNQKNLDPYIQSLSEKCCKLKYFRFCVHNHSELLPLNSFQIFSKLFSIRTLNIKIFNLDKQIQCKCEYFKSCINLRHLNLDYQKISDEFFKDIGQHIPNLRSIDIDTKELFTDQSLLSLSDLKKLKSVRLGQYELANEYITDIGVCKLIESCTDIEDIYFRSTPKITNKTIDKLIAIASQRNRKMIKFWCSLSHTRAELQFDPQIDINRLNNLPQNLKINLSRN